VPIRFGTIEFHRKPVADLPPGRRSSMAFPIDDSIATWVWKLSDFAKVLLQGGMKSFCGTTLRGLVIIQFFLAANAGMLCAQSNFSTEGVTYRSNRTLVQHDGEWTPLSSAMEMPGGIKVFTNGMFQVNDGEARHLQEGRFFAPMATC